MNHPLPNTLVLVQFPNKHPLLGLLISLNKNNTTDIAFPLKTGEIIIQPQIPYRYIFPLDWNDQQIKTSEVVKVITHCGIQIKFEGARITPIHFYTYNGFRVLYGCHATQGFITIYTDEVTFHLKAITALPRS